MRNSDESKLLSALRELAPRVRPSSDRAWNREPALRVIDCVLSLDRRYDVFVSAIGSFREGTSGRTYRLRSAGLHFSVFVVRRVRRAGSELSRCTTRGDARRSGELACHRERQRLARRATVEPGTVGT
jgi:hypothetical protein